jgi:signal peptidase I
MTVQPTTMTGRVPSGSMAPTLGLGQAVTIWLDPGCAPRLGDIVVFHGPAGAEHSPAVCGHPQQGLGHPAACSTPTPQKSSDRWIKRIVAGPGDTLAIKDGAVILNGEQQEEPYCALPCDNGRSLGSAPNPSCNFPSPITIPPDHWFMLGDNRAASADSRMWGPVPRAWIVGPVQPLITSEDENAPRSPRDRSR